MHTNLNPRRIEEPLWRALRRSLIIAMVVAAGFAAFKHEFRVFLPVLLLALWPSLGGHFVEVAFANFISARIAPTHSVQVVARLLVWFVGGAILYLCMFGTAVILLLPIRPFPLRLWWCGGLAFIIFELVLHAFLASRGNSHFYRPRP
jgi:hypothetical protein